MRLAHALRYRAAGLGRVLGEIDPDIMHAHFVVEHGFYGAVAGFHPLVVSAWGSDVLVEPRRDPISRWIARWTLRRADLVTSNNAHMAGQIVALGAPRDKVEVVTLGADRYDLGRTSDSVNVHARDPSRGRVVISTRAHEPLYNIGEVIDAYHRVARRQSDVRLVVAHRGPLTKRLQQRTNGRPGRVEFPGFLDRASFRDALTDAEVFVSVPSSDATSVALLQAMAAGSFPIVSDLPSQRELIDDGVNGFRVPVHRVDVLAERIAQALDDDELRRRAAEINRRIVEERGLNETQMAKMERLYLRLAGRHQ
jgi:glycosyltransferase involved in cell wall biosynthesis